MDNQQTEDTLRRTTVVHVRSTAWAQTPPEQRIYIGRTNIADGLLSSRWSNPYRVGVHGSREECIKRYLIHLRALRMDTPQAISALRGKVLGCWCKAAVHGGMDLPCHGDVLAVLADGV